jgi:hypothetical protein
MAAQYGPSIDKRLNTFGRSVESAEAKIAEGDSEKETAWKGILELAEEVSPDKPFRFIANNGHTYALQERKGAVTFDEGKFQALIFQSFDKAKATKIWNSMTKRVLDTALMEAAVRTKKITQEMVDECLTVKDPTFARVHPKWTKDDRELAKIFGVKEEL